MASIMNWGCHALKRTQMLHKSMKSCLTGLRIHWKHDLKEWFVRKSNTIASLMNVPRRARADVKTYSEKRLKFQSALHAVLLDDFITHETFFVMLWWSLFVIAELDSAKIVATVRSFKKCKTTQIMSEFSFYGELLQRLNIFIMSLQCEMIWDMSCHWDVLFGN